MFGCRSFIKLYSFSSLDYLLSPYLERDGKYIALIEAKKNHSYLKAIIVENKTVKVVLEETFSNNEILENYLNTINLGQNTLGVQAASQRYFGKNVSELTLSECATIAAITKSPNGYNPITNPEANAKRREKVLRDMKSQGFISEEEFELALEQVKIERMEFVRLVCDIIRQDGIDEFSLKLCEKVLDYLTNTNPMYHTGKSLQFSNSISGMIGRRD